MDPHTAHKDAQHQTSLPPIAEHLAKACAPLTARVLTKAEIDNFIHLHDIVRASLPEDKKKFVKKREADDVDTHLAGGNLVLGVFSNEGELIAQALLVLPNTNGAINTEGYFDYTGLDSNTTAIIQAVGVHPTHKKCGAFAVLMELARKEAKNKCTHIVAKMSSDNQPSQNAFGSAEYTEKGTATRVKDDDYASVFMVRGKLDKPTLSAVKPDYDLAGPVYQHQPQPKSTLI